jgi:hypothetical protein
MKKHQKNRIWTLKDVSNNSNPRLSSAPPKPPPTQQPKEPWKASFCQPTTPGSGVANVPLYHIPTLRSHEVCRQTLERIREEFLPIIRRRGYNVLSISEFCCSGDGLDYVGKKRPLRKQPNNVLGYNSTRFFGNHQRSHTIHIRLRDPRNHLQLLSWEDVAGTMAHELSHCVHQNHGQEFYKLMEEILEDHASNMINGLSSAVAPPPNMPISGGNRLGGNSNKSRLLNPGRRLGDGTTTTEGLRQKILQTAEARQRLMQQTRTLMERAKEPCVIEIYDSDDKDEDDTNDDSKPDTVDLTVTEQRKRPASPIDLTASPPLAKTPKNEWSCTRCTFRNKSLALFCDACSLERP